MLWGLQQKGRVGRLHDLKTESCRASAHDHAVFVAASHREPGKGSAQTCCALQTVLAGQGTAGSLLALLHLLQKLLPHGHQSEIRCAEIRGDGDSCAVKAAQERHSCVGPGFACASNSAKTSARQPTWQACSEPSELYCVSCGFLVVLSSVVLGMARSQSCGQPGTLAAEV